MKAFQLTAKKKIALKLLAVITVVLVIYIINIQTNQPDNLPENYIGLWKSHWHEQNKAWLYPAKQYAIYAEVSLACLSAWIAASKAKFWK